MNIRDSIVSIVKEVIADAESSGVAQQVTDAVTKEVTALEEKLKAYIDAELAKAFAPVQQQVTLPSA